jgi:hypothetical protein
MQPLIETLKKALTKSDTFIENLPSQGEYYFRTDYPVAVVHHKKRVKDQAIASCLNNEGFLDADGYTPNDYDAQSLSTFESCASGYVKKVSLICSSSKLNESYTFKEKLPGDYWKKIVDPGSFEAVIEYSQYTNGEDICKIEFELRELMRSSKEVPSLKVLPYVWVVKMSSNVDISKIMRHYFEENFELIEEKTGTMAIGWSQKLQEVNMRYFVCPPPKN